MVSADDLDLRVRTIGLKRINEARTMAQERQAFSRKGRFNPDGSIKILGEFKLGQKGGTYSDKVPINVVRPGRESTPPAFHGLTPKKSHPAALSQTQFLVTVRRQCELLPKQQQLALFAQYGAYPVNRHGMPVVPDHIESVECTPALAKASSQVGRLSTAERAKLFREFHMMIASSEPGCGQRHKQLRAAASTPSASWKPQQQAATLGGTGRSLRGTGRGLAATGGRGFGSTGRVGGLLSATGRLGMTGQDFAGTGRDLGATGQDLGGTGRDLGMTGQDFAGTGRDLGATGQDLGGTGRDLGMTGQDFAGTGRDLGATGRNLGNTGCLLVGDEKTFTPAGTNQRFHADSGYEHGQERLPTNLDYGNAAKTVSKAMKHGTVKVPVNECGRHGFARNPMGGFFQAHKGGPQEGIPMVDLRENPRSGMLSKISHGSGQALRA